MKKLTNHMPGLRGVNTDAGTVWIEPGQTVEIDPKSIVGALPDLGKPPVGDDDTAELDALKVSVADLTKQVESLTGERDELTKANADLTKQVESLTGERDELTKANADLTKQVESLTAPKK